MGIRIPALLEAILEATAAKTGAEARIAGLRKVLDEEARRRYATEGAAPSWKRRDLGAVRLDEPGAWTATVADPAAFGSYIAQHHPTEATAVIEVPAADLEDALAALKFIDVDVADARVEVRPTFATKYLEGLIVDVEEQHDADGSVDRTITVVDPATGALVDGTSATRSPAKLVVTLDRVLRAQVIEQATAEAGEVLATVLDEPGPTTSSTAGDLTDEERPPALGRVVTLEELVDTGVVRPAAELTAPEAATVARFDAAPDALTEDLATRLGSHHREPYVGTGADGARRSAQIDREEADGYDPVGPDAERYAHAIRSAERWDAQADELEALALLPADSYGVRAEAEDTAAGIAAVEAMDNREALRRLARAQGINPGGTKRDLAERLYAAGVRA